MGEKNFPGLMETKMEERLDWSIDLIKKKAKDQNIEFSESLFKDACEMARTLFVRSEIAYSGGR